jgi:two-component system, LytTR family, response regulator LytT
MEELLPADRFMRVHRSFIIALDHIDSVSRNVVHIGKTQITVSENHKEAFLQFLGKWMGG